MGILVAVVSDFLRLRVNLVHVWQSLDYNLSWSNIILTIDSAEPQLLSLFNHTLCVTH